MSFQKLMIGISLFCLFWLCFFETSEIIQLFSLLLNYSPKMGGDCVFNVSYCDTEEFKSWLRRDNSDKGKGRCIACDVSFKIGRMGMKAAIESHVSSTRHKENIKKSAASTVVPITEFLKPPATKDIHFQPDCSSETNPAGWYPAHWRLPVIFESYPCV
jgi:hypothetical protein